MVKPIYLQDNLSKTLLAQEMMDRLLEGVDKARDKAGAIAREQIEYEARNIADETGEKTPAAPIRDNAGGRREKRRRLTRKKKDAAQEKESGEKQEDHPRERRPEDDEGKGGKFDVRW